MQIAGKEMMIKMEELLLALKKDELLLNGSGVQEFKNSEVKGITYDSREVKDGYVFVAIKGEKVDGHSFVESVLGKGAIAIVETSKLKTQNSKVIEVKDTRKALAVLANKFYNEPSKKLKTIGVTGTFGKTTSTWLLKSIYDKQAGYTATANAGSQHSGTGLIGTIEYFIGDRRIPAHHTTPESLELQKIYAELIDKGIKTIIMEVSSHSLDLERVYKTDFDIAGFTTLERDHLDYHKTIENYRDAKLKLFSGLKKEGIAVLNRDSDVFEYFKDNTKAKVVSYGTSPECDVYGKLEKATVAGTEIYIKWAGKEFKVYSPLIGGYNLSNILLASTCALGDRIEPSVICEGIQELKRVPGRFEIIGRVIIDYAHTPGALESALHYARQLCKGRLICIFGCGGDRDTGKRSLMGKAASETADYVILTTDNPRSEDPLKIIKDIEQGFSKPNYEVILDRKEAIEKALKRSADEDLILLAGKGHENYQIYGELKVPWDERKVVEELIANKTSIDHRPLIVDSGQINNGRIKY